jgi:tetratricopeptide (TPR) repeat protein
VPLIILVAGIFVTGSVQRHVDGLHEKNTVNGVLYLPNDKLLKYFTGGLSNILADLMWYQTVQYTAKEFNSEDARFSWLEQMIRATNRLDPYYVDPYRYGGIFLAGIGDDEVAEEILQTGLRHQPNSWELPYELHSLYLMNRRHEPGAQKIASHYAYMIAERIDGEMKQAYFDLSRNLLLKENMVDEAVEFFTRAVKTADDPLVRAQAEAQLHLALLEKNVLVLNKAIAGYERKVGREIVSLEELVTAGLINAIPNDPDDGEYVLDANRKVVNTVLAQPILDYILVELTGRVHAYRKEHGRNPESFKAFWPNFDEEGPKHPIPGRRLRYDPVTGIVDDETI